jgi:hypothetical protein
MAPEDRYYANSYECKIKRLGVELEAARGQLKHWQYLKEHYYREAQTMGKSLAGAIRDVERLTAENERLRTENAVTDRCAYLQQQITDRDRFIATDRSIIEQRDRNIADLKRLLDRAYPWLHNPYTPSQDALLCAQFDAIKREIQVVIAHLPEKDEPPVTLPCGSCDGTGQISIVFEDRTEISICPNCAEN